MAAYRRVYDSRHLQADCHEPGSAPELYAGWSSMDYLYLFIPDSDFQQNMTSTDLSYWSRSLCISRENARRSVDVCVCVCVCVWCESLFRLSAALSVSPPPTDSHDKSRRCKARSWRPPRQHCGQIRLSHTQIRTVCDCCRIHRVKWRHIIHVHDTIAILWV